MFIDVSKLPPWAKIELTKESLLAFADRLRKDGSLRPEQTKEAAIMTIEEAASFLGLARQTLYGLTSKRAIPFYKKNKRLYFKKEELLSWVEEGKKKMQRDFDADIINHLSKNLKK